MCVVGLPSDAELAKRPPGLSRDVLPDVLKNVRTEKGGLAGLPTERDFRAGRQGRRASAERVLPAEALGG